MKNKYGLYFIIFFTPSTLALELLQTRVLSSLYYNNIVYLLLLLRLWDLEYQVFLSAFFRANLKTLRICEPVLLGCFPSVLFLFAGASFCLSLLPIAVHLLVGIAYFVLTLPFIFSGCTLGLIFMTHGRDIYRLYFLIYCKWYGSTLFYLFTSSFR